MTIINTVGICALRGLSSMNETDIIRVYIPNGSIKNVRYDFDTKIQRVIHVVLSSLGIDKVSFAHFALRLIQFPTTHTSNSNDCFWLHGSFTMRHVYEKYFSNSASCSQLRFELRLRFVPKDLQEMYQTQIDAFMFLHEQVLADYLSQVSWRIPTETAMELASLQLRKRLGNITVCAIEKCVNLEELEAEGLLVRYLPETIIVNTKPKALRKSLLAAVKRNASLSPTECIFKFLMIVLKVSQFDVEIFRASLGAGWTTPIDIIVGMRVGISYSTELRCMPTPITQLRNIVDISVRKLEETSEKAVVQLKLTGSSNPMSITVPNSLIAESFAHLLDGYQMLLSQQGSVWTPKELMCNTLTSEFLTQCESLRRCRQNRQNESEDHETLSLKIDRSRVCLEELLGDGQFGNVYRGTYTHEDDDVQAVAIKVCKVDSEPSEVQNFLEEALVMRQFHHSHIIKLIGICNEVPIWIIMELAPFGELRHYLMRNRALLDLSILLLYSQQLSSAIAYLHSCKFVHRDIAARNVLVSTARSVKLSDFGLSRCIQDESFYTSSQGKLPIKWMAPESINYRRFNTATDIWMFGVCIWEILMYGVKPWQGVRNHEVILKLEGDERLPKPENCPSVLYDFLRQMWTFDSNMRPTIDETNRFLNYLLDQIDCRVPFDQLRAPSKEEMNNETSEEVILNGNSKAVPILKVDASTVPTSTLWRTLEQQRIQSEEDEKWLEEEEEKLLPLPTIATTRTFEHLSSLSGSRPLLDDHGVLPHGYEFDRSEDNVHRSVFKVVGAVSNLSKFFSPTMESTQFVALVKVITNELKELFHESSQCLATLQPADQRQVQLVETLLGADMRNMASSMRIALDENATEDENGQARREVLKTAHQLAFNCKHFLESVDSARLRSNIAKLKKRDSLSNQRL
uniref:receptor protein-tyrosine kinase n=2 Tax=Parascaris univalens TaxID=6257 RepID=A0A915BVR5_PARUN